MRIVGSFYWLYLTTGFVLAQTPPVLPQAVIGKDLVYSEGAGYQLHLDLARPATGKGPFATVLCFHGGGWQRGNKASHGATLALLAKNGFAAAAVEYRLTPRFPFPAQIEDAKCAARYLRSRAKELNLDPQRFAALGDSAGGHISLMLGFLDPADGFEGAGCHAEQPSRVQAVINIFGPSDLTRWHILPSAEPMIQQTYRKGSEDLLRDLAGTNDRGDPRIARLSPITYINKGDPPVLTFQGTLDPLVPVEQAHTLHDALRKAGVPERLEIIEGGSHIWAGKFREISDRVMIEFLRQQFSEP